MSKTVTSTDGTRIAYDKQGSGPAVVLVDGAFGNRGFGANKLAEQLASDFTVYTYDRRGRNESGDTAPYAIEREVEDIAAIVDAAGGSASLYGISSGAALALEAAARLGGRVVRVAAYEPPYVVDDSRTPLAPDFRARVEAAVAEDRRGDVVKLFMREAVLAPRWMVALIRVSPAWPKLKAVAHTLPYDLTIMADGQTGAALDPARFARVTGPVLVADGGKSPDWMRNAARNLAEVLPNATHRTLPGQTHMVKPKVLAPVLKEFFTQPEHVSAFAEAA
jgi:pimeloyl-ACP methyl ester carboxylesterase